VWLQTLVAVEEVLFTIMAIILYIVWVVVVADWALASAPMPLMQV
jgi:hypothetical protein